jgi:PknH-like extracellular domain
VLRRAAPACIENCSGGGRVRLRLGVGGGAFGIRGGISTRGFGVGVGPVSAGWSWRRRRRRRAGGSGGTGGWSLLLLIGLVVAGVNSLFGHTEQPPASVPGNSTTYSTHPLAALPGTSATYSTQPPATVPRNRATYSTQPSAAVPGTTTTLASNALEGLLLSPDQIGDMIGATGMRVAKTYTAMKRIDAQLDQACLPLADSADTAVYARSGAYATRGQGLDDPDNWTHRIYENVVLFSSPHDAAAFFTTSAQAWPTCSNRLFTVNPTDRPAENWIVGPVSNTNGTLSATKTQLLGDNWNCQRALTVVKNVAVDVEACGKGLGPVLSAVSIADQIAAKVPTH